VISQQSMFRPPVIVMAGLMMVLAGCEPVEPQVVIDPAKGYIDARTVVLQAAEDEEPATRSHAMEALAETMGYKAGSIFLQAIADDNPAVRFAAIMALGDVKYTPAKDELLKMAGDADIDRSVLCAIIYALYRMGDDTYAGALGTLLFDGNKWVRANAALAMGKMSEPSAIGPLRTLLADEQDPAVQLQLVESLAVLGDVRSANLLEAYTKTPFLDDRLVAILAMGRVGSIRSVKALRMLQTSRQPPRVRVAAAGTLGRLGQFDQEGYELCITAVENPEGFLRKARGPDRPVAAIEVGSLQRLAAISLGWMGRTEAVSVLYPLLSSRDGGVRVAAAMSMLRILEAYEGSVLTSQSDVKATGKTHPGRPQRRVELHTAGGKD